MAAAENPINADPITEFQMGDLGADPVNDSCHLMAGDEWEFVHAERDEHPLGEMQIGMACAARLNPNEDILRADGGHRDILDDQGLLYRFKYHSFHVIISYCVIPHQGWIPPPVLRGVLEVSLPSSIRDCLPSTGLRQCSPPNGRPSPSSLGFD